jgi:D-sedoheptulose 7-phosphate isomerase
MPIRHVILDRDGVLNREAPGGGWVTRPEDWVWEAGALEALSSLAGAGIRVSVATNQSGIGRGEVSADAVDEVHRRMEREADAAGGRIDAIFQCSHGPDDGCDCRKPAPGLIHAAVEAAGVPPAETIVVGDDVRDLRAARAAGVRAVLVRTGKGMATEAQLGDSGVRIYDNLAAFARAIVTERPAEPRDSALLVDIREIFERHRRVMDAASESLPEVLERVVEAASACLHAGGRLLVCGNGGSAADAQHLAAELVCRFRSDRAAIPAIALTTDTSSLTAIANDYGFERVFARQVEALARPGDMLVAISTSGNSANVVEAARQAKAAGCTVVALTGASGGRLADEVHLLVAAPSDEVARIQEVHELCIHVLAGALEDVVRGGGGR